jgi:hypothetical protein
VLPCGERDLKETKEGEERNLLRNYKTNIRLMEAGEKKLADVKREVRVKKSKLFKDY